MEDGNLPQLADAEVRRFLSSMKIDHSGFAPGRKLDKLLRRAIKKAENLKNLTEAVAEGSSGHLKIDPSTLPWCAEHYSSVFIWQFQQYPQHGIDLCIRSSKDDAAIEAFSSSFTFHEVRQGFSKAQDWYQTLSGAGPFVHSCIHPFVACNLSAWKTHVGHMQQQGWSWQE